jgi:hypothetical protein
MEAPGTLKYFRKLKKNIPGASIIYFYFLKLPSFSKHNTKMDSKTPLNYPYKKNPPHKKIKKNSKQQVLDGKTNYKLELYEPCVLCL